MTRLSTIFLMASVALIALTSCSYVNKKLGLEDDNVAEEMVEAVIDAKTGLNIDLTPASPEA